MRGVTGVIGIHGAGRLAHAHIGEAGVLVDAGEIGAAHCAILVEQESRAVQAAVLVQGLGLFEVADRVVEPVVLLLHQRGVQPGGRVARIDLLRELDFARRMHAVTGLVERLGEVAPQDRAPRLERRGHLQVFTAGDVMALADAAQAPAEPRVAQRAVERNGGVEGANRVGVVVLGGVQEALQRVRLGVARGQFQAGGQRLRGFADPAETEFEFGHARPGEGEVGQHLHGFSAGPARFGEAAL